MSTPVPQLEPLAIVAMTGKFPAADDLNAYWQNSLDKHTAFRHFSLSELLASGFASSTILSGKYISAYGAIDEPYTFDPDRFNMTAIEADALDPQARLFLGAASDALEAAGIADPALSVGVYACSGYSEYWARSKAIVPDFWRKVGKLQATLSREKDFLPSVVSYRLNLHGPSIAIQAGCSSSLVAVAMACNALRLHECDVAVAGGVAVPYPSSLGYDHEVGGITSPTGRCSPFDASADGTVPGQGVGVVVIKRLNDALAAGDHVLAVIKGYGVANDGSRKVGYTAPSVRGQTDAMKTALAQAGVPARSVGYVEAHGTGTSVGDPIELRALSQVYLDEANDGPLYVGSAKANVGHLDAASGIAGLIRAVLAVRHRMIPPLANFSQVSGEIQVDSRFRFPTEPIAWPHPHEPLRAAVNSVGLGGNNVHMIIEAAGSDQELPVARELMARETQPKRHWFGRHHDGNYPEASARPFVLGEAWVALAAAPGVDRPVPGSVLHIVFASRANGEIYDALHSKSGAGSRFVWVTQGDSFEQRNGDSFVIRTEADCRRLFDSFSSDLHPAVRITYGWGLDCQAFQQDAVEPHTRALLDFPSTVAKCASAVFGQRDVSFVLLSKDLAALHADEPVNPLQAFAFAPARTIPREYPPLRTVLLDIRDDAVDPRQLAHSVLCAGNALDRQLVLAQRAGGIWRQTIVETPCLDASYEQLPVCAGGVYVITGGLGGIGLEIANYLAIYPRTRIALIARNSGAQGSEQSVLDSVERLAALRKRSAELLFIRADVSDAGQVRAAIAEVTQRFGKINGIFHSAGVAGGALMHTRNSAEAADVLAPKVAGLMNLAAALDFSSLDFVVLCSSLTSWGSHLGQYDYCAGNAFLDAFARHYARIKPGVVKSISWDVWSEVGMATKGVVPAAMRQQRIESLNQGLSNAQGLLGLEHCLASSAPHAGIASAFGKKNFLHPDVVVGDATAQEPPTSPVLPVKQTNVRSFDVAEAAIILADIFKDHLGLDTVPHEEDFFDLGGDSLKALSVADEIAIKFACKFDPVELIVGSSVSNIARKLGIEKKAEPTAPVACSLPVSLSLRPGAPTLYCVHPLSGHVMLYSTLARELGDWALKGLAASPGIAQRGASIEQIASSYLDSMRQDGACSPYNLLGYSFGAVVVLEMVRQITAAGERIDRLVFVDPPPLTPGYAETQDVAVWYYTIAKDVFGLSVDYAEIQALGTAAQREALILERAIDKLNVPSATLAEQLGELIQICMRHVEALESYRPAPVSVSGTLLAARAGALTSTPASGGWANLLPQPLDLRLIDCRHTNILDIPYVRDVAEHIRRRHQSGSRSISPLKDQENFQ